MPEPQLRDLYQRQGLSFDQIAAQLNAPGTLDWLSWVVSGLADEYGIRRRPGRRGSVDNRKAGPGFGNPAPRSIAPSDPQIMRLFTALSVEPRTDSGHDARRQGVGACSAFHRHRPIP